MFPRIARSAASACALAAVSACYVGPPMTPAEQHQRQLIRIHDVPAGGPALAALPNLTLLAPEGSREPITVVSKDGRLWLALLVANTGRSDTTAMAEIAISVDGEPAGEWDILPPIRPGETVQRSDIALPQLSPGRHEISVALDPKNRIRESIETDNVFMRSLDI